MVWGEHHRGDASAASDTIMYTRLDGGQWLPPVDILAAPIAGLASPEALVLDRYGRLALIWRTNSDLRLSTTEPGGAGDARRWTTSVLDANRSATSGALAIAAGGDYHLVFVRANRELVYMMSPDGGSTWQRERTLAHIASQSTALSVPCVAVGANGERFVAWALNAESLNWAAAGVQFAYSVDDGQTWSEPRALSTTDGHGLPSLYYDSSARLHVAWIGNLSAGGRFHVWSQDGGVTFSPVSVIVAPQQLRGYAGKPQLLEDSAGTLHALIGGIGSGRLDSIWHSDWARSTWSPLTVLSAGLRDSQAPTAVIESGHRLHVAWMDYVTRDVWYAGADTGTPAASPVSFLSLPDAAGASSRNVQATRAAVGASSGQSGVIPEELAAWDASVNTLETPTIVLARSLIPPAVLLVCVLAWRIVRRNR